MDVGIMDFIRRELILLWVRRFRVMSEEEGFTHGTTI